MKCTAGGLEYGLSLNRSGPLSAHAQEILEPGLQAPANGGVGYYLGEALKIPRSDDNAIPRTAKDPRATVYGTLIWIAATLEEQPYRDGVWQRHRDCVWFDRYGCSHLYPTRAVPPDRKVVL